jgi:hypothetical protein
MRNEPTGSRSHETKLTIQIIKQLKDEQTSVHEHVANIIVDFEDRTYMNGNVMLSRRRI